MANAAMRRDCLRASRNALFDQPSCGLLTHGAPANRYLLEFGNSLQRHASQALSVTRNGTLPLALQSGHPAIDRGDELTQVLNEAPV